MKGIILAGGSGTRLYPLTLSVSKQILPVYNKPMIYYPLSVLMLAGIREILIISTPRDKPQFEALFGDGSQLGISLSYAEQASPDGLAQAFIIGRNFIGKDPVALILGDNIFYGHGLPEVVKRAAKIDAGATVFGYRVTNPESYGVVAFNQQKQVIDIEEKPAQPKSNFAITGLYFYGNEVVDIAETLTPSPRGELEITDLNRIYLQRGELTVELLGRGYTWLDTGTHESLIQAGQFVQTMEARQGIQIACLEEIALHEGFIDFDGVRRAADRLGQGSYSDYLRRIAAER